MRVRRFAEDELAPFHAGFIEAGGALGLPREDRLESLDVRPAVCAEPSNSPEGIRWNAAFAYLDPVRGAPGLEIRGDTLVDRVVIRDGRAAAVRAIGPDGPFELGAGLVVLCGGTYGSPAILLRSGIGPSNDLAALGIKPSIDLPGVGGNLHDHPAYEVFLEPTSLLEERTTAFRATGRPVPDEQGFASIASSYAEDGIVDAHVFSEIAMDGRLGLFVACLTPRSKGRLRLGSAVRPTLRSSITPTSRIATGTMSGSFATASRTPDGSSPRRRWRTSSVRSSRDRAPNWTWRSGRA
jgi:choline dehydrogenase